MSATVQLKVLHDPDPRLRLPALEVDDFGSGLEDMVQALARTMHEEGGIGLAAPQVGWLKRLALVNPHPRTPDLTWVPLINPVLVGYDGEQLNREGCLSLPGCSVQVLRPARVTIAAYNPMGRRTTYAFAGLAAACVLHEMDHLEGRLMADRNAWGLALPAWRRLNADG